MVNGRATGNDAMMVRMQMGGRKPDLTVEESTKRHLALMARLTKDDNGKYFSAARGEELPY